MTKWLAPYNNETTRPNLDSHHICIGQQDGKGSSQAILELDDFVEIAHSRPSLGKDNGRRRNVGWLPATIKHVTFSRLHPIQPPNKKSKDIVTTKQQCHSMQIRLKNPSILCETC